VGWRGAGRGNLNLLSEANRPVSRTLLTRLLSDRTGSVDDLDVQALLDAVAGGCARA
jgi:hypothetical protein